MANVLYDSGNILDFRGDAVICFCNSILSQIGDNLILRNTRNEKLSEELSAIGYCEVGNAVITQSYNSVVKNYLFIPSIDRENEVRLNNVLLHKALRSTFALAKLYGVNKLAISLEDLKYPKDEAKGIIKSVIKEFDNILFIYE